MNSGQLTGSLWPSNHSALYFRSSIESMKGHENKIRIVLNKADMVDHQELMRVYGALMWSLGKVFNTPEVARLVVFFFKKDDLNISFGWDCK